MESVKRQEMQRAMRHDDDVRCADLIDERRHQVLIQLLETAPGRFENLPGMRSGMSASQHEILELEPKALLQAPYQASRAERVNNSGLVRRKNEDQYLVSSGEKFNQSASLGYPFSNRIDRCD